MLRLLVVRHAIAEDRATYAETGNDDDLRPLTKLGRRRMRKAARGLMQLVPQPDLLVSSPLVRARQTADLLADAFGDDREITEIAALSPGASPEAFTAWLGARRSVELVAAVGHEPTLSIIVTWLLAARPEPVLTLKKGAACLLEFGGPVDAGAARLRWALTPRQLRLLADV